MLSIEGRRNGMSHRLVTVALLSVGLALTSLGGQAADEISGMERMPRAPHYRPPVPGAPRVRVDGRVRGADDALLTLTVLAPEHVGLTTKEQPCLYWYQSKAAKTRFELTIIEAKGIEPLLEVKLDANGGDAIRRVCLAEHNVKLKTGIEYRWSVALVLDPENRSKDVLASGVIKRIKTPKTLESRLSAAKADDHPYVYADEGVWSDSLEALSALIDGKPGEKQLHEVRAVYFMQAGLPEAARHEMKLAGVTVKVPKPAP
jgi:hypothetical protein